MNYIRNNLIEMLQKYEYIIIKITDNYNNIAPKILSTNFSGRSIEIGFKKNRNKSFHLLIAIIENANIYELLDLLNFFKVYFYNTMEETIILNQVLEDHSKILLNLILKNDTEDSLNHDDLINENLKIKNEVKKLKESLQLFIT